MTLVRLKLSITISAIISSVTQPNTSVWPALRRERLRRGLLIGPRRIFGSFAATGAGAATAVLREGHDAITRLRQLVAGGVRKKIRLHSHRPAGANGKDVD